MSNNESPNANKSFKDLFETTTMPTSKSDDIIYGKVLPIRFKKGKDEFLQIDCNLKTEGIVPIIEFGKQIPKLGEIIPLIYLSSLDNKMLMSYTEANKKQKLKLVSSIQDNKKEVIVTILSKNTENYSVKTEDGIEGILLSKENYNIGDQINSLVSKVSQNGIIYFVANIMDFQIGDIVDVVVTQIADAFLIVSFLSQNSGKFEGIIHKLDIYWHRASTTLKTKFYLGRQIKAKVINIIGNKVCLSIKHLQEDAWSKKVLIEQNFQKNQICNGVIEDINTEGLVINIGQTEEFPYDLEGFIYISDIAWYPHQSLLRMYNEFLKLKVNDKISCKIISIEYERRNLKLSIKALTENPYLDFEKRISIGTKMTGNIVRIDNDKFWIELEPGIFGVLFKDDLSWDQAESNEMFNKFKDGDKIEVVINKCISNICRIYCSVKVLAPNKFGEFLRQIRSAPIDCEVIKIYDNRSLLVKILNSDEPTNGVIKFFEIPFGKNYNIGDKVRAKYVRDDEILKHKQLIPLSIKALEKLEKNVALDKINSSSKTEIDWDQFVSN